MTPRVDALLRTTAVATLFAAVVVPVQAQDRVYSTDQGAASIEVIDAATFEIVETVDLQQLGFGENAKPHHIAVEPDGSFWYVSLIGENRVLKFDRDNELVGQAEFEVPGMLSLSPVGDELYVGRSMSAVNPPMRIGAIRRSDMSVDEIDVLFPRPHALITHPSGDYVYSASLGLNRMAAVDAESWDPTFTDVPGDTHAMVQFAVSPDGSTLVVTGELTGDLLVFDLSSDPSNPIFVRSIDVGSRPWHPIFGRDGQHVYFGLKGDDAAVEVDVVAGEVTRTFSGEGFDQPHGAALSPDGRYLFVTNNGPGGMGMDHGAMDASAADADTGGMDHGGMDHTGSDHGGMDHGGMDHGGHDMGMETTLDGGTVVVIDLESGETVRVIPVGPNATGIGAAAPR